MAEFAQVTEEALEEWMMEAFIPFSAQTVEVNGKRGRLRLLVSPAGCYSVVFDSDSLYTGYNRISAINTYNLAGSGQDGAWEVLGKMEQRKAQQAQEQPNSDWRVGAVFGTYLRGKRLLKETAEVQAQALRERFPTLPYEEVILPYVHGLHVDGEEKSS